MSTTSTPAPGVSHLPKVRDLTREFPRSPNKEIAGYVLLARLIDKCRATLAGRNGEYLFNCPLDQRFFEFTGIDAEEIKAFIASGATDEEIGQWVKEHDKRNSEEDVLAWSYDQRGREPEGAEAKAYFEQSRREIAPKRYNVRTWFQLLDAEEGRL
ncbi:MAG: DUF5069 domain-containing protein [Armatimonadetes bacterium]|nr:DUF5069 domain-containing protein [Armatimonadota bacterium]